MSFSDRVDLVSRFHNLPAQQAALLKGAWAILSAFREEEWARGDETRRAYETALALIRRAELSQSAPVHEPGFQELEVFALKRVRKVRYYYMDNGESVFVLKTDISIPIGSHLTGEFSLKGIEEEDGMVVNYVKPKAGVVVEVPAREGEPRLNPQNGEPLLDEGGSPLLYRAGELAPPILLADFFRS